MAASLPVAECLAKASKQLGVVITDEDVDFAAAAMAWQCSRALRDFRSVFCSDEDKRVEECSILLGKL